MNTALVAMDLSSMDEKLLLYTQKMTAQWQLKRIVFAHVIPCFVGPNQLNPTFSKSFKLEDSIEHKIEQMLYAKVQKIFAGTEIECIVRVAEGSPYHQLGKWLETSAFDLLIIGKKSQSEGSGLTARRLARKVETNILFVPEMASGILQEILVPIDFSANAARALKTAIDLRNKVKNGTVQALFIAQTFVPGDYLKMEAIEKYRSNYLTEAKKAWEIFKEENNLDSEDIELTIQESKYGNIAREINTYLAEHAADLVLIGAKGHSFFENFVYGSVTEELVTQIGNAPVLVVR